MAEPVRKQLKTSSSSTPSPPRYPAFSSANYVMMSDLGSGTHGTVSKARSVKSGNIVAIKRVDRKYSKYEADIMIKLAGHQNILRLFEMASDTDAFDYMIMECCACDLRKLYTSINGLYMAENQIKGYIQQMLDGVQWMHSKGIIHRDLKPDNLLLSPDGYLKVADFGLAVRHEENVKRKEQVVSMWYRSPELLMGTVLHETSMDIWSCGCIMAELLLGRPLLPGETADRQLDLIWELCGTPNENGWTGAILMPNRCKHAPVKRDLKKALSPSKLTKCPRAHMFSTAALDLLDAMLTLDPKVRPTAADMLKRSYFVGAWTPQQMPDYSRVTLTKSK